MLSVLLLTGCLWVVVLCQVYSQFVDELDEALRKHLVFLVGLAESQQQDQSSLDFLVDLSYGLLLNAVSLAASGLNVDGVEVEHLLKLLLRSGGVSCRPGLIHLDGRGSVLELYGKLLDRLLV